jgi:hypothetical protein
VLVNNTQLQRVSEQEARFLFIRELEKQQHSFYYSVETPTEQAYCFSGNDGGVYPGIDEKGQFARFDVCLYEFNGNQVSVLITIL